MEKQHRIAFIKALVAAAWADQQLDGGEIATLSHYLQALEITNDEYEQIKPLLDQALEPDEARHLLEQQLQILSSAEERRTLVAAVVDLLVADDELTPEEAAFLSQLRNLTQHVPTAQVFIARLKGLWGAAPPARPPAAGRQRPKVEQFRQRRMLEFFRWRIVRARARAGMPVDNGVADEDLLRVVIWAGLLSRVAHADEDFCPAEKQQLMDILSMAKHIPLPDLEIVVESFAEPSTNELDISLLVQAFNQITSDEEGRFLLDSLFLVAAADGKLKPAEIEVIQEIASGAGFSSRALQAALERCQQRMISGWN